MIACENAGHSILDQFPEVGKLVELCRKIYQYRRKYTANRERTYGTTKEEGKGRKTYVG